MTTMQEGAGFSLEFLNDKSRQNRMAAWRKDFREENDG
jgi:hypothetical protein